ncbi:DUF423 domain-containing protein [Jiella sp. M17.18]|uniref:DUF423 domain-containing protein n=1 Tax=Jiella sp. M17.18 TaxID=3234247 RepID=UPI0034DFFADD
MKPIRALAIVFSGLYGACGVGGAAVAAHGGDNRLVAIAAAMALFHAPALIALSLVQPMAPRLSGAAIVLMILGVLLFSGDLAMLAATGTRPFEGAAPTGGSAMILAWLLVAIAGIGLLARRERPRVD